MPFKYLFSDINVTI